LFLTVSIYELLTHDKAGTNIFQKFNRSEQI